MMVFAFKMVGFVFKMMVFAFKMMNLGRPSIGRRECRTSPLHRYDFLLILEWTFYCCLVDLFQD